MDATKTTPTTDPSTVEARQGIRWSKIAPLAVLLVILLALPVIHMLRDATMTFMLHILITIFMHVALASSWNVMGGYTGYISLGHNVFFAVGGYFGGVMLIHLDVPVFVSAPFAGLLALGLGLLVGLITLRVRGPSFIISTVALVLVTRILIDNWAFVGGANGMSLPLFSRDPETAKIPFYYGMLVIAVGALYGSYRIRHSKLGLGLRAISQDEIKAESAGIPTNMYKILAFALSGFFIGAAGSLWGHYTSYLSPGTFLLILVGAQMVLMSILGGKGTVAGPAVGAVLVVLVNEFFLSQFGGTELNIFGTGLLLLLVLMFFPDGVVGSLRNMKLLPGFLDWD